MNSPAKLPPANPMRDEEWKDPCAQIKALREMLGEFAGHFQETVESLERRIDKIDEEQALLKAERKKLEVMRSYLRAEMKRIEV